MGSCLSKKGEDSTGVAAVPAPEKSVVRAEQRRGEDVDVVKKEIFLIKHRRSMSHDKLVQQEEKQQIQIQKLLPESQRRADQIGFGTPVRSSSCTREEVDAILIQCGRLSRSSSANTPAGKKHSGSKRSFDFDNEGAAKDEDGEMEKTEAQRRHSRSTSSPSKPGRRRTPSRERDSNQQRSGSRERSMAGSGRRVSRSPGRRSETPSAAAGADTTSNVGARPGKMVSVPASVTSSLGAVNEQSSVRRVAVRRDVRSPRSQSPAQSRQHPPLTLSRSNSKKTDQSPHRRNPLSEIDNNHSSQTLRKPCLNQSPEEAGNRSSSTKRAAGVETYPVQTLPKTSQVSDSLQPKLSRSRSRSRSRDLDELQNSNPNPNASSYASILLEDIQNFHQKSSNSNVAFALPQCVTKACSILEAVADLNSTTSSSIASNEESTRRERNNDLMEPILHKYVTTRRGGGSGSGGDMGDQESSGSNSVAGGGHQRWGSPSEPPGSVESAGCLTSKASTRNRDLLRFQRQEEFL